MQSQRMTRRRAHAVGSVVVTSIAILLASCGGGSNESPALPPPSPLTDVTAPTAPTNVIATATSAARVDLTWTAATDVGGTGVASYRVFRNGGATAIATVTATSHADTTVTSGITYTYQIRAVDVAGNVSVVSNTATATTPGTAPTSGLDARPSNTSCLAWNRPTAGNTISLAQVFGNLPAFNFPIAMLQAPGSTARWFVVEQAGFVRVFDNVAAPAAPTTFIDIDNLVLGGGGSERGLLGMAFHPNFPTDPRVFLSYTAESSGESHISSFRSTDGGLTLDRNSEQVLLRVTQPESNHNGGNIAFSPIDGYLYIGLGDGGGGGDGHSEPLGNGQRLTTMLGKILRIDVGPSLPGNAYSIPSTNPYASGNSACPAAGRAMGNCPEIYAYGFRNPWRWSFDRQNGNLWVGDVGQGA